MRKIMAKRMQSRLRRIERRLDRFNFPDDMSRPMMCDTKTRYEMAGRVIGTACRAADNLTSLAAPSSRPTGEARARLDAIRNRSDMDTETSPLHELAPK